MARYFIKLHQSLPEHSGIVICSQDQDWENQAAKIGQAIASAESLKGKLARVYKTSFLVEE